jgi:hypothetical protein
LVFVVTGAGFGPIQIAAGLHPVIAMADRCTAGVGKGGRKHYLSSKLSISNFSKMLIS